MLPRISEQSNIPHVSLSVALISLDREDFTIKTNQFHPSTHPEECLDSDTVLHQRIDSICRNYLEDLDTEESLQYIARNLAGDIVTYIDTLKSGKLNNQTLDMTVNQKANFVIDTLNDRLYHLTMSYVA